MSFINRFADSWLELYSVHMLETALFISLVWMTDRFIRRDARLRYVLWNVALIKVFIPPVMSLPHSIQNTVHGQAAWLSIPAFTAANPVSHSLSVSEILFMIWCLSVFGLTFFILMKNIAMRVSLRKAGAIEIHDKPSFSVLSKNGIQVFESENVNAPVLLGVWLPRMYLPQDWRSWSSTQLRSILTHESAHLSRRDIWILVLQYAGLILCAINPFVWLMHKQLVLLRELRCDETAIRESGISPVQYSKMILRFVEKQTRPPVPLLVGEYFAKQGNTVRERIHFLLNLKEATMKNGKVISYLLPVFLLGLIIPFSWHCNESQTVSESTTDEAALSKESMFQAYDEAPRPIGGFEAIQQGLKYPEAGREAGVEGKLILHVFINENGDVEDAKILESIDAGNAGFEEAAIASVKRVKWTPAKLKGKPVKVWVAIPIVFKLSEQEVVIQIGGPRKIAQKQGEIKPSSVVVAFDQVPKPIDGFAAIQKNLHYPEIARKAGIEGKVIVHVLVSEEGDVLDTKVLKSLGQSGCDEAAVNAVKSVKWKPAKNNSEPVKVWVAIPVVFKLR
ncbi:MAG: TonB family protein [bacterium]